MTTVYSATEGAICVIYKGYLEHDREESVSHNVY